MKIIYSKHTNIFKNPFYFLKCILTNYFLYSTTTFFVEKRVITPQQPANGIPASPATTPIPELKGSPTGKKIIPRRTTSASSSPLAQNKLQPLKGKSIE